ncbi:MAG: SDR family NAD(P)-dependent oxidoreductase [Steroidobacteraceae bacterium]
MKNSQGRLTGKVAIVTGAATGIGEAIARRFLAEGAQGVVVDRPGSGLVKAYAGLEACHCLECDVTDADAPQRLVEAATKNFGGLDILVNNAGIAPSAAFEELTDELWDRTLDVNLRSVFRISRAAVGAMKQRGGGRIINLGSVMSEIGGPGLAAYGASKHAVAGLSKCMAVDLGPLGITVNYLEPGVIVTNMTRPFLEAPGFREHWEQKAPVGRLGQPDDVAACALFLALDEAAFVSGFGLRVDGGALVNF